MKSNLIFQIAQALLLARWRQTLVAAIGVTFSIAMFITLLSFMSGLNDLLDGLIINRTPHVRLYNELKPSVIQPVHQVDSLAHSHAFIASVKPKKEALEIYNAAAICRALDQDDRVLGYAPKISAQVFYNVGTVDLTGLINGVDIDKEKKLFMFDDYVVSGSSLQLKNVPNSIVLGKAAAEKMLAEVGDVIQVTTSKGEQFSLKVVGLFQSGLQEIDKVQSYTSIETARKLLGSSPTAMTDIQVKIKDIRLAPNTAKEFSETFECEAVDIQTANAQFETGSFIRTLISYAVGLTLLIVSGFGIYNILNMMIYEKMDSIAILKATGFSGKDVQRVFISIALSIGVFGGVLGLLFGFLISFLIDQVPFITPALPTIKTFPVSYNPTFYLIGIVFSIITTYLAGYFPAKKASFIDPVVIIRGK